MTKNFFISQNLKWLRRLFLFTFFLPIVPGIALGQDELLPVLTMFDKGMRKHEFSMVSNAASRCGALNQVVGQVLKRDTNDNEVADNLIQSGNNLLLLGMATNKALFVQRNKEIDNEELKNRSLRQLEVFTEHYVKRMTRNQASTGEMWGSDDLIKSDLLNCASILEILGTSEWLNTLTTYDWTLWDKAYK